MMKIHFYKNNFKKIPFLNKINRHSKSKTCNHLSKESATISIPDENGVDPYHQKHLISIMKTNLKRHSTIQLLQTEEKLMQAKTLEENKRKNKRF